MTTPNEQDPKAGATPAGTQNPEQKQAPKAPEDNTPPPQDKKDEGAEKRIKELNEENKKQRLKTKELEEKVERFDKAIKMLTGTDETPDPVKIEKQKADGRVRRAYLKAAVVGAAATEMHDAGFAFDAMEREFANVTVDLETGSVDDEAVRTKLAELKGSKPFLFRGTSAPGQPPPKSPPDGGGQPAGGDPYKTWLQLKGTPGREAEAQKFYNDNRANIFARMPK